MSSPGLLPSNVERWLEETYPDFRHCALGVSGAALLFEAFRREERSTVVLPAFTSYTLSGAATAAGKRVIHVDADVKTLHMRSDSLDAAIHSAGAEDVMALIDHTCGHPFTGIEALRQRHPGVLIVEDCVRALGGEVDGKPVGSGGDWTLLSLYKTTPGNLNGAILLSRTPMDLPNAASEPVPWRQRIAGLKAARQLHQRHKRGPYSEPNRNRGTLRWTPKVGAPDAMCLRRFVRWLSELDERCAAQRAAVARIRGAVGELPGLSWIEDAPGCTNAAHFASFLVEDTHTRNGLLESMHRRGCPLERTWHVVPSFYRGFAETFSYGSSAGEFLADHILHIPMAEYPELRSQDRLIAALRAEVHSRSSAGNSHE